MGSENIPALTVFMGTLIGYQLSIVMVIGIVNCIYNAPYVDRLESNRRLGNKRLVIVGDVKQM